MLVGAGIGSLVAAIRLTDRGLKPLVIERSKLVGGACAYSGGIVWAPVNHRMRAKGLADSAEEALAYLESIAQGRWDPAVARAYIETVPPVLEWLEERTLVHWVSYPEFPDYFAEHPGGKLTGRCLLPHPDQPGPALDEVALRHPEMARVRRAVHFPGREDAWAGGWALVGSLWAKLLEDETPSRFECRATSLVREGSRVTGVVVEGANGTERVGARRGVLLNTGGFEWNAEATRRWMPDAALMHPHTPPSNEGDGQAMAEEVGAAMALMDESIRVPSVRVPGRIHEGRELYRLLFRELALPHSIVVNRDGRRFANETFFQDVARTWVSEPRNLPSFLIFDDRYRERYGLPGGLELGQGLSRHASLEELAAAQGISAPDLAGSVGRYNAAVGAGRDDEFGRGETAYQRVFGDPSVSPNPTLGTVERAPFYSVQLHLATSGHRGGAVTDRRARVLDRDGDPIPGLAACGNAGQAA